MKIFLRLVSIWNCGGPEKKFSGDCWDLDAAGKADSSAPGWGPEKQERSTATVEMLQGGSAQVLSIPSAAEAGLYRLDFRRD